MTTSTFDTIVVGLGAMGSGATYQLAKRGVRVLGLDARPLGHADGSSHGHHRMIRRSAFLPEVARLSDRAFELWRELEAETGHNIMNLIGEVALIDASSAKQDFLDAFEPSKGGTREILDAATLHERFPGFRLHDGMIATWEAEAGFLRPEVGIAAHLEVAQRHGAVIQRPEEVTGWGIDGDGVRVDTTQGVYRADRLIVTAGPWASELLADLGLPLQVVRIVNIYFEPERPDWWTSEQGAPDFTLGVAEGGYYGMPSIEGVGVKIGRHDNGEPTTARTIRREVDQSEIDLLRRVLDRYMPGASGRVTEQITCMYTMTPDEQHIVERHPIHPQVAYGCGFSGTGYKFCGVVGEILADLTQTGTTRHDIAFMSSSRFAAMPSN